MLLKRSEDLYLDALEGVKNIVYQLDNEGYFNNLRISMSKTMLTLHISLTQSIGVTLIMPSPSWSPYFLTTLLV